jgi:hypothetical protein
MIPVPLRVSRPEPRCSAATSICIGGITDDEPWVGSVVIRSGIDFRSGMPKDFFGGDNSRSHSADGVDFIMRPIPGMSGHVVGQSYDIAFEASEIRVTIFEASEVID